MSEAARELLDAFVTSVVELTADAVAARLAADRGTSHGLTEWRLLNLREAAERLGRSERWVRERVRRGDLATVRLDGGALAFTLEDLQAFVADRRMGGRRLEWH